MARKSYDPAVAKQHVEEARQRLESAVEELMTDEGWQRYLRYQTRFHHYSWGNTLLIWAQKPDASHLKGFKGWLDLGRQVRKGEKGIRILAPRPWSKTQSDELGEETTIGGVSFTTVAVFDVSQTDPVPGHPHPFDPSEKPFSGIQESGDEEICADLIAALEAFNLEAGRTVSLTGDKHDSAQGYFMPSTGEIWVRERELAPMLATFIHETAHALTYKSVNAVEGYAVGEVVAESVSFIVCDYFGLEATTPASEYVAAWLGKDSAGFKKGLAVIQKTAHELIEMLSGAIAAPAA